MREKLARLKLSGMTEKENPRPPTCTETEMAFPAKEKERESHTGRSEYIEERDEGDQILEVWVLFSHVIYCIDRGDIEGC